jgi:hypothetical protein
VLAIHELRKMVAHLSLEQFSQQVGPFALIQRPPDPVLAQLAMKIGARTSVRRRSTGGDDITLAMVLDFEELVVATLPPLRPQEELSIGRLPDNDLVLEDPSVSNRHARLRWNGDSQTCEVEDLGSSNGTLANGIEVHGPTRVYDGNVLRFGDTDFWFLLAPNLYRRLADKSH